jgi:hypothetical protein
MMARESSFICLPDRKLSLLTSEGANPESKTTAVLQSYLRVCVGVLFWSTPKRSGVYQG